MLRRSTTRSRSPRSRNSSPPLENPVQDTLNLSGIEKSQHILGDLEPTQIIGRPSARIHSALALMVVGSMLGALALNNYRSRPVATTPLLEPTIGQKVDARNLVYQALSAVRDRQLKVQDQQRIESQVKEAMLLDPSVDLEALNLSILDWTGVKN